jgi:hypothetical protein
MKKLCLIEFYSWHSECLDSQIRFLSNSEYSVTLACECRQKNNVEKFRPMVAEIIYFDFKKFASIFKLWFYLIKNKIDIVVFNTAQGSVAWKFMLLPFPKTMKFFGLIHIVKKLETSFGQKIINRKLKNYYLLAEYLENYFPKDQKLKKHSFSSAFFMPFERQTFPKKVDDCWICVPGHLEYKRRDYDFLLSVVQRAGFPKNTKFILLGNSQKGDGQIIMQKIKDRGISGFFICFDGYIPDDEFQSYLNVSDFLLPLIHGNLAEIYKYQISGTFVLSDAYGKTMLCDEAFSHVKGFEYNALYYKTEDDFIRLLQEKQPPLPARNIDFEENRLKYINFLKKNS